MIKLCVEDYCHDCPRFEPEVKKDEFFLDGSMHTQFNVFCECRHECASIKRHVEKKMREEKNNES